ncbi:hypothetical protein SMICM304S_00098 [Streptomyces microflavus]
MPTSQPPGPAYGRSVQRRNRPQSPPRGSPYDVEAGLRPVEQRQGLLAAHLGARVPDRPLHAGLDASPCGDTDALDVGPGVHQELAGEARVAQRARLRRRWSLVTRA